MIHRGVRLLSPDDDNIATLTPQIANNANPDIISLINEIGTASSKAQGLAHIITTYSSFVSNDNKIYILVDDDRTKALGFVKIGPRHLFLWDRFGIQHEMQPICLLDFFTYPSEQRKGYGKKMIDRILRDYRLEMKQIPIDRPSSLCLSFMKKHFGLSEYIPQNNKFVVFDQFWTGQFPPDYNQPSDFFKKDEQPQQPMTPPRPNINRRETVEMPKHAKTPGRRTGLNPITWLPYD
ncbi:hypothetical protein M9Y10_044259 [Tritrichomonas musculus]|uniref:Alpha-tubulin N-acetyltransferase n=1 Tax=Tritrichomonas musculus TaxID=1915356 RepID=A0ABR2K1Y8_9EUKA